jgi:hypothetical protein
LSLFAAPAHPAAEVVALDNEQVRVVRVEGASPAASVIAKNQALYVYFATSTAAPAGTIAPHQIADGGPHFRIELKHSSEPAGMSEIRPAALKPGVATEFDSSSLRIERVALAGGNGTQTIAAGKPSLLVAFSPTIMQLHSKPRSFTITLNCGDFYWMRPFESAVLKRTKSCDGHVLRIVFLS